MFLLDTNVVSGLRKVRAGKADPNVAAWARAVLAERRDPVRGAVLRAWLDTHVLPAFSSRILAVDLAVARSAAALNVSNPRPIRDGLIAATALAHCLTVVTRNVVDFLPTGVALLNPWD